MCCEHGALLSIRVQALDRQQGPDRNHMEGLLSSLLSGGMLYITICMMQIKHGLPALGFSSGADGSRCV